MRVLISICLLSLLAAQVRAEDAATGEQPSTLHLVVMDPLAAPLSCPCVEGYAQRKYELLAAYLEKQLGRAVTLSFGETLEGGLKKGKREDCHIVIGKDSVVRGHAGELKINVKPLARLTGKDGKVTQTGLIVVRSVDPAKKVSDLAGYRILYGPPECDEKFKAPREMLAKAGIEVVAAEAAETTVACSDGACKIIEWGDSEKAAAVISSYAAPLLEGCGTIQKGELRVVAETEPVPFVTAFATDKLPQELEEKLTEALLGVAGEIEVYNALETLSGFVPLKGEESPEPPATETSVEDQQPAANAPQAWKGWRGPARDGHAAWLPKTLPAEISRVWSLPLVHPGLGGIAATEQYVLFGDRDATNTFDIWRCLDAATGIELWQLTYHAPGQLDYDNFPRATPLIEGDRVYLQGAFGHLTCADLKTGAMLWQTNIRTAFGPTEETPWGSCASPLLVDGKLIVNPGSPTASLAAIDPATSLPLWQTPGSPAAYGSFIAAKLGGRLQIVGYDNTTLGGWDLATGERLWTYEPPNANDFNVPMPTVVGNRLLLVTENNSARLFDFTGEGKIIAEPTGYYRNLAPDMSSPVVVGNRIFCVCDALFCLKANADGSLREIYAAKDDTFVAYAPIIASGNRLLIVGLGGELLLVDSTADEFKVISRQHIFADDGSREADLYPHPAIVASKLYVRGERELICVELGDSLQR